MDTVSQNESQILLQSSEAAPLDDRSRPADEVLAEQRAELDGDNAPAPTFIP